MRRLLSLLLIGSIVPALAAQEVRITIIPWPEPVLLDTLRQDHDLGIPSTKVYDATHRVFSDLGIPIGNTDGKSGVIGSERFERRLTIAGLRMSKAFDCGEGPSGPYADTYRLEIAVVVYVKPNGKGGTTLGLASIATGRDPSGAARAAKGCVSTGALEQKLYGEIAKTAFRSH